MTSPRLTAATALLAALSLAACSDGGGATTTATPASGITSAATGAATEPAPPSDAFATAATDLPTRAADGTVYPGETWEQVRPRALGFDAQRMEAIARDARPSKTTCLLVARKGQVVGEWNWGGVEPETPREVFSVTKSITSTLIGMAQADGDLDVDDRAKRYIEEWRGTKSRSVTIRDILSNVSGRFWDIGTDYGDLPQAEDRTQFAIDLDQLYPPGKVWTYNNAAIQTLDRVVSTATGAETRAVTNGEGHGRLKRRLGDGDVTIPRASLTGVAFKRASMLTNGRVTVATADDTYQLHFRTGQQGAFETLALELGATV